MSLFFGTLIVFVMASVLLGLGMIIDNRKLQGGCGHKPADASRCANCPGRKAREGESDA